MAGEERAASPQDVIDKALASLNDALVRTAQSGLTVKVSIRSFPAVGRIARCPQVKAEVQGQDTK